MNFEKIQTLVESQRKFFKSNATLDVNFRIEQLKKLKAAMKIYEKEITDALARDLGRSEMEAYFCDIGPVIMEVNEMIHGIKKWSRSERHFSGLTCFPSIFTKVHKMPYGVSLIISPFNFPILLSFGVLAASIAGGNTAVIKVSSKSKACSKVLKKIVDNTYPPEYVSVIEGGHDVADMCLEQKFDKIFYTGSPCVAKHVMEKAAQNLTPIALELGGETGNWCVVRKDANLKDAARKIAFLKSCNSGQICININQIAVASEIAEDFVALLKDAFTRQVGANAEKNPEYSKLISLAAYDKCSAKVETYREKVVFGGRGNRNTLKYAPTIIFPVDIDDPIVKHELFCPILPIVTYNDNDIEFTMQTIAKREHGLALYLFTKDIAWAEKTMRTQQYGGGCINEVCVHMMVKGVPFNGVGHSGMGAYHGEWGFREFTHPSTVLRGYSKCNLSLREHPYNTKHNHLTWNLIKLFER